MTVWRVDSFHIGLGVVGDSAIHLLVEEQTSGPATVSFALLVDGGAAGGLSVLHQVMREIGTSPRYNFSTSNPFKFDAIVVSHWDADHYGGVLAAMADDVITQAKGDPNHVVTDIRISFLKYDSSTTPPKPTTIMYCPAYGIPRRRGVHFPLKPDAQDAAVLSMDLYLSKGGRVPEPQNKVNNAVLMRAEPTKQPSNPAAISIIGTNILTGVDLDRTKPYASPTELVASNKPASGQPGIYIVAASKRTLQTTTSAVGIADGVEIVEETEGTPKNESSVACMIIWPGNPARLSHYFAGDMHWTTEDELVEWTGATGVRTQVGAWVTTTKLSHHGSKSSTPTSMLKMFNPRSLIASVAERNGHPSWELVFYLAAWMNDDDDVKAGYKAFLTTQFPYYLMRQVQKDDATNQSWLPLGSGPADQMSMKIWTSNAGVATTYKKDLQTIYADAGAALAAGSGSALTDPMADWTAAKAKNPKLDAQDWARGLISRAWNRLSPVPPTAHAGKGAARAGPNMQPVTKGTSLLYFRVVSRNDDQDGTVYVKYCDNPPTEQQLWPDPNFVPATNPGPSAMQIVTGPNTGNAGQQISSNPVSAGKRDLDPIHVVAVTQASTKKLKTQNRASAATTQSIIGNYNPSPGTNPDENSELVPGADSDMDTDVSDSDDDDRPVLEPLPLPDLQPGKPTTLTTPNFFICASSVQYASPPGPTVCQLTTTSPLNGFLSLLHMKGLILKDTPQASAATLLHAQDEFQGWIAVALGSKSDSQPSVAVSIGTTPADIQGFTVTVPAVSSTFTSAAAASALGLPSSDFGPASTVTGQNALVLGLSNYSGSSNFSLAQVLAPAALRGATLKAVQLLSKALGSKLNFNLDTSSTANRNAIWFEPATDYKTVVRSQYVANAVSITNINDWIGSVLTGFSVLTLTAITKLTSKWVTTAKTLSALNSWEFILVTTVALDGVSVQPTVVFDFTSTTLTITLQFDYLTSDVTAADLLASIMTWITGQISLKGSQIDFQTLFDDAGASNFDAPLFRRMVLVVDVDDNGKPKPSIDHLTIDLELGVKFGQHSGETVVFLFTYEWSKAKGSVLRGTLWTPPPPGAGINPMLLPEYERYLQFTPASISDPSNWADSLNLLALIPSDPSGGLSTPISLQPDGVPTDLIMAELELNSTSIHFSGALECDTPSSDTIPKLMLSRLDLDATYTFSGPQKGFIMAFAFGATMNPEIGSQILPIELRGSVNYGTTTGWAVVADVETPGMQGAHFLNYFDQNSSSAATALIQHIQLLDLHLEYHYQNPAPNKSGPPPQTNPATNFTFSGDLLIGQLELVIDFQYTGSDTWSFKASAGANGQPTKIQAILDSIVGDGTVDLPSCVGDILVGVPKTSPPTTDAQGKDAPPKEFFNMSIQRAPATDGQTGQNVVFTVSVNVGPVAFTFLQLRNTSWSVNSTASKRLLRVEVDSLPEIDIPIIGNITQPFDEMYFMWVQDGSKTTASGSPPGLTKAEVDMINTSILPQDNIYYKLTKAYETYQPGDVLVQAGCHFVVVLKDKQDKLNVVLDYVFAQPTQESAPVPSPAIALKQHAKYQRKHGFGAVVPGRPQRAPAKPGDLPPPNAIGGSLTAADDPPSPPPSKADAGGGTTKAAMKKSIGPFQISNLGIRFCNSKLSVCLDAEVAIGPIAAALLGFSIDLDFSGGRDLRTNFPSPANGGIGFSLKGLAASFDRPPLTIAGGLLDIGTPSEPSYAGGINVGFETWMFLAAGGYAELIKPGTTDDKFRSLFVFAKLDGPLVTLEFAVISGVTGGFGYNNTLTLPAIAEVPSFPFLAMPTVQSTTGNPTMDVLMALIGSKWFNPLDGTFWVAAGLTVSAFEMLDITAVAVIEWGEDIRMGLYALAVADIPSTLAPLKLAHIELGILAMVDFGVGVAKFEAQLAPSSYILDPSCHLSGGFALYYWFKDGPQQAKGDWVFTIGGYHPLYKPPPQYPVPPRLQISWALGPLAIVGQAYFAITPMMAMAGTKIHAGLSIGVLQAFFDAYADFIINYNPFTFVATGGVSVGVKFKLDLLFVTIHISVEIGATLVMRGPPVAGTCHVNFWVFGFDIDFGSRDQAQPQAIDLSDFYQLVLQKGGPSAAETSPVPMTFNCQTGLISPSTDSSSSTAVASTTKPQAASRITELDDDDDDDDDDDSTDTATAATAPVWQVHAGTFTFAINCVFALSSVTVYPTGTSPVVLNAPLTPQPQGQSSTSPIYSRPMYIEAADGAIASDLKVSMKTPTSNAKGDYEPQWKLDPIINNVPKALWDAYDPSLDPNTSASAARSLAQSALPSTVPLMTGVLFTHPSPVLSADEIPMFSAVASNLQNITAAMPNSTDTASDAWIPAPAVVPPPDDPAAPWEKVQAIWGKSQGVGVAEMWTAIMGWTGGTVQVQGAEPVRLVDGLQQLYVASPLVSAAVAA